MEESGIRTEDDDKALSLAKDIIRTLTKAIKTFNVYPSDNPIYKRFAQELFEKFDAFFQSRDELVLDVGQYSLLFHGNEVFYSEERTDNIALLLFADGIRQIDFHKGITSDEIIDFINILRIAPKAAVNDDDDIVTLLWEKNIRNMGYSAVEDTVGDDLVIETALLENPDEERSEASPASASSVPGIPSDKRGPRNPLPAPDVAPLTPDELSLLKRELRELDETSVLSLAGDLFFEMLSSETSPEALPDLMQSMGKLIDFRMRKKDVVGTLEILTRLGEIADNFSDPLHKDMVNPALVRAGSIENLGILFREVSDLQEIRRYLFLINKHSVPAMIEMLGQLGDRRQRRLLCEVLAEVGKHDLSAFSEALRDDRWYLLRNISMILGMIKDPAAVDDLGSLLEHGDVRVRKEALRALEGIQSAETKKYFLQALRDKDQAIRIIALRSLRRFSLPDVFQTMKTLVSLDELKKKTLAEKKETLETLAVVGGESALGILSDLFRKKGLLETDEATEVRVSAAHGLGALGTPEAMTLLEKETSSRKALLRETCVRLLRELQKSGNIRR